MSMTLSTRRGKENKVYLARILQEGHHNILCFAFFARLCLEKSLVYALELFQNNFAGALLPFFIANSTEIGLELTIYVSE